MAQRWVLACLRNEGFTSLHGLNVAVRALVSKLNNHQMRELKTSRAAICDACASDVEIRPLQKPDDLDRVRAIIVGSPMRWEM